MGRGGVSRERLPACAVCGKPVAPEFKPFCSQRCADVDLGRWFNERYAIPVEEDEDEAAPKPGRGHLDED
jgi:uncharacterized protein